jgi:uncharacterized protein YjhX (UPF0386 family)
MEKFEKTKLFKLKQGDRFYYATDKKMKVHEVDSFARKTVNVISVGQLHFKPVKTDREVVFLRNKNENN